MHWLGAKDIKLIFLFGSIFFAANLFILFYVLQSPSIPPTTPGDDESINDPRIHAPVKTSDQVNTSSAPIFYPSFYTKLAKQQNEKPEQRSLRVLSVFGTRPEVIKMAPLIWEMNKRNEDAMKDAEQNIHGLPSQGGALKGHQPLTSFVCVTGQHRQMIDPLLKQFRIQPDMDLNLMTTGQTQPQFFSKAVTALDEVISLVKPDIVFVQGDTTTAMVAGLGAFYHKIPVAHVEAGLRTRNIYSPFPEEMNRHTLAVISKFHFAPTQKSAQALRDEQVPEADIFVTGNTVIDTLLWMQRQTPSDAALEILRKAGISPKAENGIVQSGDETTKLILVTAHRRESFGEPFENIVRALKDIVTRNPNVKIVFPVHLNPQVQEPVRRELSGLDRVILLDPLGYEPFIQLLKYVDIILTDSGGIQEEATALAKPTLVMRNETERTEGIDAGVVKLIGTDRNMIVSMTEQLLNDPDEYAKMAVQKFPYGDGTSSTKIIDIVMNYWSKQQQQQQQQQGEKQEYANDRTTDNGNIIININTNGPKMNGTAPKVSIVLPTYNSMDYLPEMITSVMEQDFTDFELIVVNDASTDGTSLYLSSLKDPRIRVIHNERNSRLPSALNIGFSSARGRYLTWVSSDNRCTKNMLRRLVTALDAYPEAGYVYADYWVMDDNGAVVEEYRGKGGRYGYKRTILGNGGVAAFMYRRETADKAGIYDPDLEGVEDWNYFFKLSQASPIMLYVPEDLHYYRVHENSMTTALESKIKQLEEKHLQKALRTPLDVSASASADPLIFPIHALFPMLKFTAGNMTIAKVAAMTSFGEELVNTRFLTHKRYATEYLKRLLRINPGSKTAKFNIALAYAKLEQWAEASSWTESIDSTSQGDLIPSATLKTRRLKALIAEQSLTRVLKMKASNTKTKMKDHEIFAKSDLFDFVYDNPLRQLERFSRQYDPLVEAQASTKVSSPDLKKLAVIIDMETLLRVLAPFESKSTSSSSSSSSGQPEDIFGAKYIFDESYLFLWDSPQAAEGNQGLSPSLTKLIADAGLKLVRADKSTLSELVSDLDIDIVRSFGAQIANSVCKLVKPGKPELKHVIALNDKSEQHAEWACINSADYLLPMNKLWRSQLSEHGQDQRKIFPLIPRHELWPFFDAKHENPAALPVKYQRLLSAQPAADGTVAYNVLFVLHKTQTIFVETFLAALSSLGSKFRGIILVNPEPHALHSPKQVQALKQEISKSGLDESRYLLIEEVLKPSELAALYSACRIVIPGTGWEDDTASMPAFAPAMAHEAVLVAPDVAPLNEYVEDSVTGILVKDAGESPSVLADAIQRGCTDKALRTQIRENMKSWGNPFTKERVTYEDMALNRMFLN